MRKRNYLNNKDILLEIHRSKNTFNSYLDKDFNQFDIILPSVDKINRLTVTKQNVIKQSV